MINRLQNVLSRAEVKKVAGNILSLSFLQFANYLLPLITLPYITRVLGPEKFGLTAFAFGIIQYFTMLTDFGFNMSATRKISIHRSDPRKVSRIFFSVMSVKWFLLAVAFLMLIVCMEVFPAIGNERLLYYVTFLGVVGSVLFPQWYYQGIEQMKFMTIINVSVKICFTGLVFVFVRSQDDYLILPLLTSLGYVVAGVFGYAYSFRLSGMKFNVPSFADIAVEFREGWYIFLSNLSINLYTTSNSVLIGIFTNNTTVGIYAAAERIFRAIQYLGMPVYQALFPHFSKLISENRSLALRQFRKLFRFTMAGTSILALLLSLFSGQIMAVIAGPGFSGSAEYLRVLAWVVLASWGNYYLGIQGLVNFGYEKVFSSIVLVAGIVHIAVLTVCLKLVGAMAVPFVWFFTELAIFACDYWFLKKYKVIA